MDAESWETRERRFRKKFDAGREHIPEPVSRARRARRRSSRSRYWCPRARRTIPRWAAARCVLVSDLMREIMEELCDKQISENAVPEHHTLLRTLQLVVEYRKKVFATLR